MRYGKIEQFKRREHGEETNQMPYEIKSLHS